MKKSILISLLIFNAVLLFAQTSMKEYKAGHVFNVSLPDYMSKTAGLNSAAAMQYKNVVKDVYGIIIFDTKEELQLVEMNYASANEFYEAFIGEFLIDQEKRNVSKPVAQSKNGVNFIEADISYFDKDAETEIYYLIGIVETKSSFYKVLSWCTLVNKDKFKADFQKILYSLKD